MKTNLLFFTKGLPTERIWYYDLSGVKVGKKSPLTVSHFDDFLRLPPDRADGFYRGQLGVDDCKRETRPRSDALAT